MDEQPGSDEARDPSTGFAPGWYRDPWEVAPWRWWDGRGWTAGLYGDYGEAWPSLAPAHVPFVPKGPGIKGGGIAAVGAGVAVFGTVAVAVVFVTANGGVSVGIKNPWYFLSNELVLWVGFVGAVVVASTMNGSKNLAIDFGLSWPRWQDIGTGLAGGALGRCWPLLIALLGLAASGGGLGTPSGQAPRILGAVPQGTTGWSINIVIAVVGAPIVEELFFRGLVQGALTRRVGATPALFITALIFAVIHVTDEGLVAPLVLFPMALILGYLRQRTGRLAAGMVAHATFNASLFALFLIPAFR